jgi:hypothetical protein
MTGKRLYLSHIACWGLALCNVYMYFRRVHQTMPNPDFFAVMDGLVVFLFLALLITGTLMLPSGKHRTMMLFALASIALLTAPLLVVKPIGARCFFALYALLVLFCHTALNMALNNGWLTVKKTVAAPILIGAFCWLFLTHFAIYRSINAAAEERLVSARRQADEGHAVIAVVRLPYTNYVWVGDPTGDYNAHYFKAFYKLPYGCGIDLVSRS